MLSQYGTRSDNASLRETVHTVQHDTNQLAKDTSAYVRELSRLPLSTVPYEQRQQKLQRERLIDEFMKTLNSFQNIQRLEKEMEKSRDVGQRQTSPAAMTFSDDDFTADYSPRNEKSANSFQEIAGSRQQMSLQIDTSDVELELLRERQEALSRLEADITDVNQIFKDLGMLVHEQGDMIDSIEANVESASVNIEQGTEQLRQASNHQSKARKTKCILLTILLVVLAIIIIIIVAVVKTRPL
jgi:t-SNARE complex subunit (syntaxin)